MRGGGSSVLVRAPDAESRGICMVSGIVRDEEKFIRSGPALAFQKLYQEIITEGVSVGLERMERESVASLMKAMVVLYGTPANVLEACAELEGGGLPKVGWVKESGI